MKHQRGLGILGAIILLGMAGGAYYGASVIPVYVDNLSLKQDARGIGNEWLSKSVVNPAELDRRMRDKAKAIGAEELELNIITTDSSATFTVRYKRVWKLMFTNKAYAKRFSWTVRQSR